MALGLPGDFSFLIPKLETWSQIEKNPGSWEGASCRTGTTLVYKDGDAFLCSQTLKTSVLKMLSFLQVAPLERQIEPP